MVAQDGYSPVAVIEKVNFGIHWLILRYVPLVKLILEGDGGVVSPKDLGTQVLHHVLQVVIEPTRIQFVKEGVIWLFTTGKFLQVLVNNGVYLHCVVVPHGVFTQEIQGYVVFLGEANVLHPKGGASDCVSFILPLFIANSQS